MMSIHEDTMQGLAEILAYVKGDESKARRITVTGGNCMKFTWLDYPGQYVDEIETWCDAAALQFALDEDTAAESHQWHMENDYQPGYNYYCKVILDGETPVAFLMLDIDEDTSGEHITEDIVNISALVLNPSLRGKGYGTQIITELLENQLALIDHEENIFVAQIHEDNEISQKLMGKLGFTLLRFDGDDENEWFNWVYPKSATERFSAYWDALEDEEEEA